MAGSYRPAREVRAVWVTHDGRGFTPGLVVAWRRQTMPSDGKDHWFGLVVTVKVFGEDVQSSLTWVWSAYILPIPCDAAARQEARRRQGS